MKETLLMAIFLAGCATALSETPDGPIPYREGFQDGCDSGYQAAGHIYYHWKKSVERFEADKLYASGWQDGYDKCKTSYMAIRNDNSGPRNWFGR